MCFVQAALPLLETKVLPEVLHSVFDQIYLQEAYLPGHRIVHDLDVGELLLAVPELVRDAFGKAASGLLQFANTRFCLRRVLQETLTRIETNRSDPTSEPACPQLGWDVADDRYTGMVMLLRSPRLGTSEQSLTAVFSFLGQLEYFCKGRLWARYQAKRVLVTPQAPMLLCCQARDVPSRVELLATKVLQRFCHLSRAVPPLLR